ncbi:MAG: hypothetical protein ABSD43_13930, partial [Terracidiphilus sp.]
IASFRTAIRRLFAIIDPRLKAGLSRFPRQEGALGKVEPNTVQSLLRHSNIQTTLDLYTQEDSDETRAAQGSFLIAMGLSPGLAQ